MSNRKIITTIITYIALLDISIFDIAGTNDVKIELLCLTNNKTYDIIVEKKDLETKYNLIEKEVLRINKECKK